MRSQQFAASAEVAMAKGIRRRARNSQNGGSGSGSDAPYRVGYRRPPSGCRYQPGQTGNPKGRPKGRKNEATITAEILNTKIKVRIGSTVRSMTVLEAMLRGFADRALKGDTKTATFLLDRYARAQAGGDPANIVTTPEEHEIIDGFLEKYLKNKDEDEKK
jgi:hypothetical protein